MASAIISMVTAFRVFYDRDGRGGGIAVASERKVAIALRLDVTTPMHQQTFAGVLQYALEHRHWNCIIDEHPLHAQQRLESYDGVIARANPPLQKALAQKQIPFVNTLFCAAAPGVAGVYPDVNWCGHAAAELLLERGHHQFICLLSDSYEQGRQIGKAFRETVEALGHRCHNDDNAAPDCAVAVRWQRQRERLDRVLETFTPPLAALVATPWQARLLIQLCESRGWYVPHGVSIICIDNLKMAMEVSPTLSSIDINYERIGYEAAALLDRLMNGEPVPDQPSLIPPKGIVRRHSTGEFAVRDECVAEALKYMQAHLGDHLTVDVIADAIHTSPRSLQRRFEKELGRAVGEEIRQLRVAAAKRMLGNANLSVGTIARRCGFKSFVTLNHAFRRELKMTPTAYRAKLFGLKTPVRD